MTSRNYRGCHSCLLVAGAIHVEEIEVTVNNQNGFESAKYWVIAPSNYIRANLGFCYDKMKCLTLRVKTSERVIANEDIGGTHSTAPTTSYQHGKMQTEFQNHLMLADNPAEESSKESKYLCILLPRMMYPFACELCMQTYSDSGSMEKYTLRHDRIFIFSLYVIETSNANVYKDSRYDKTFCHGKTIILFNDICKSFKDEISSKVHRSKETLQEHHNKYVLLYNGNRPSDADSKFCFGVQTLSSQSQCYVIDALSDMSQRENCLDCLTVSMVKHLFLKTPNQTAKASSGTHSVCSQYTYRYE